MASNTRPPRSSCAAPVDRMLKSERLPELGGEAREVTVMFGDIAGFTRLSESLTPGCWSS